MCEEGKGGGELQQRSEDIKQRQLLLLLLLLDKPIKSVQHRFNCAVETSWTLDFGGYFGVFYYAACARSWILRPLLIAPDSPLVLKRARERESLAAP